MSARYTHGYRPTSARDERDMLERADVLSRGTSDMVRIHRDVSDLKGGRVDQVSENIDMLCARVSAASGDDAERMALLESMAWVIKKQRQELDDTRRHERGGAPHPYKRQQYVPAGRVRGGGN